MKRIFSPRRVLAFLLAACLMLPVTACNGIMGEVEQKNDELVIWEYRGSVPLENVFRGFQAKHPKIKVLVEKFTDMDSNEFNQKLFTEILAGKGPDIIIADFTFQRSSSVEKMMRNGVFADMSEYFADFNWQDYNQPAMEAGVIDGKRYLFPTQYTMPLLLSSRPIIEETGFRPESCTDYVSFMREYGNYLGSHPGEEYFLFDYSYMLEPFFCGIGKLPWIDYDGNKANLSSPDLKAAAEAYLPLYKEDQTADSIGGKTKVGEERQEGFLFRTYFAANYQMMWRDKFLADLMRENAAHEKGIFMPIRNKDGGISVHIKEAVGVRNNSANKELAAEFIKYTLSFDLQNADDRFYWPVSVPACRALIDRYKDSTATLTFTDEGGRALPNLSDEEADAIYALTEEIDSAYFRSPYDAEFYDAFRPYWEGKSSYEDCAAAFEKRAQIFISE